MFSWDKETFWIQINRFVSDSTKKTFNYAAYLSLQKMSLETLQSDRPHHRCFPHMIFLNSKGFWHTQTCCYWFKLFCMTLGRWSARMGWSPSWVLIKRITRFIMKGSFFNGELWTPHVWPFLSVGWFTCSLLEFRKRVGNSFTCLQDRLSNWLYLGWQLAGCRSVWPVVKPLKTSRRKRNCFEFLWMMFFRRRLAQVRMKLLFSIQETKQVTMRRELWWII